jgi:hypothetical protein
MDNAVDIIDRVSDILTNLDELKVAKAKREGKRESIISSLKADFGIETLKEIKSLLRKKISERAVLAENMQVISDKLEEVINSNTGKDDARHEDTDI